MNASRRGFFGFLAGALAAPAVVKLGFLDPLVTTSAVVPLTPPAFYSTLTAITRKAFIPKLYVQMYQDAPILSMLTKGGPL